MAEIKEENTGNTNNTQTPDTAAVGSVSGSFTKKQMMLSFLSGAKRYFILAMILTLAGSLADMVRPKIIQYTVDALDGSSWMSRHLWVPALGVIGATLLSVVLDYFYQMCVARGGELFVQQVRDRLFSHVLKLPVQWHSEHQTGDIIQRCTSDVEEIKTFLSDQLVTLVRMIVTILFAMFFIFQINRLLGLINLASLPLIIGFSLWFHGRIGDAFLKCDQNESVLSTIAQENLTGVRVVRAFGREAQEQKRFDAQNRVVTGSWVDLGKNFSYYIMIGDLQTGAVQVSCLAVGSALCVRGTMTVGELLAVISYLLMLIRPVRGMGRLISEMSKTGVSLNRLYEIMSAAPETDKADAVCPPMNRDIIFEHVNFSYPGQPALLKDLNFTIPSGSTLGILGSTGSGKSTIAHLLTRLYDLPAENGKITVGGVDLQDMKADWVRRNTGFVLQEPYLFSRTIAENLSITNAQLQEEDIREAARTACLEKTVDEFPKGFDTFVGERGVTLSGGQKQRAAIARTLTQKTPILIFDDSLSAVDSETDAMIRENLKKKMGSATMILISHRITTLMAADKILVLEDGKITDQGTHHELIRRPGLYRTIYEIQSGKEADHE